MRWVNEPARIYNVLNVVKSITCSYLIELSNVDKNDSKSCSRIISEVNVSIWCKDLKESIRAGNDTMCE